MEVRSRVLSAAVRLIEDGGLAGLSMREVARAAGVSHQAPYHYFPDRESILAAIAEEGFERLTSRLVVAVAGGGGAVDVLARAGRAYIAFALEHPALFRVMFRPDFVSIDRFPTLRACGERTFELLPKLVAAAIDEGVVAEPSARALLVLAWSVPHGLACLLLDGPLAMKVPEAADPGSRDVLVAETFEALRALMLGASSASSSAASPVRAAGAAAGAGARGGAAPARAARAKTTKVSAKAAPKKKAGGRAPGR